MKSKRRRGNRRSKRQQNNRQLNLPVAKNDELELYIEDLTHDGAGVGKIDGYALFVRGALPGEKVRVKVLKPTRKYGFAKLEQIVEASPERVKAPCRIFNQCGGCQIQHITYEAQLGWKRKRVQDALERIGGIDPTLVEPVMGMEDPWAYRNKAAVPVGELNGEMIAGFYARGSHRIVDMDHCLIQQDVNDEATQVVKQIAKDLAIPIYDEEKHAGLLRHILVRTGRETDEVMVVLVTNGSELPNRKEWIKRVRAEVPGLESFCLNINTERTNVILGDETEVLWGRDVIYDVIPYHTSSDVVSGIRFAISAKSFYQVNPEQTEVLYRKALDFAELDGSETVIDAYCGIGTISLFLARKAKHVYGVEIVPEAIEDAERNAKLNDIENIHFETGRAEEVIPAWKEKGIKADVIVVDPPRKGCDESLLHTMLDMKPKRIVYVSCDSATLARDLKILEQGGYETKHVQPVDMFPQTSHIETVTCLTRNVPT